MAGWITTEGGSPPILCNMTRPTTSRLLAGSLAIGLAVVAGCTGVRAGGPRTVLAGATVDEAPPPPVRLSLPPAPADPEPDAAASDSAAVTRLMRLSYVWHLLSLHHPAAAVRGVPLDSAFIRAVTLVRRATDAPALEVAYRRFLAVLNDPLTTVERDTEDPAVAPDGMTASIAAERTSDSILVLTIPTSSRYRDGSEASLRASLTDVPAKVVLDQTLGRLGIPAEVVAHTGFRPVFDSSRTERALAGAGIAVPDLESYASTLWTYWEEHLDDTVGRDSKARQALAGKHVVITGASSGIGQVTALKVAQAGGIPVLVARGKDKLEDTKATIELRGGNAYVFPCDLSDLEAIDRLCEQIMAEVPSVDFIVNNAGRSIRRSLRLSQDRFHDFERTMQLNYFGAIRLIMGLMPAMQRQKSGHIVNISSIGVQTNPPRFSAYVASKAALDSWSNVVASEVVGNGISFTNIHMPLVRTPMIAPTKLYDKFPTISPAQAADSVIAAMVDKPHEINTALGNVGAVAHTVAPKLAFRVLNMAYHVFPDSAAAKGQVAEPGARESEQIMLAKVFKGVHW